MSLIFIIALILSFVLKFILPAFALLDELVSLAGRVGEPFFNYITFALSGAY